MSLKTAGDTPKRRAARRRVGDKEAGPGQAQGQALLRPERREQEEAVGRHRFDRRPGSRSARRTDHR